MAIKTGNKTERNNRRFYSADGQRWAVFGAGAFAGATMSVAMLVLLWLGLTPRSLGNLIADKLATVFPPQVQEFFIQSIGPLGKQTLFVGVLLGQAVVGGLLALLLFWLWPRIEGRPQLWRNIFIVSSVFWLVVMIAGLPLVNAGFLGSDLDDQQIPFLLTSFVLFQLYGIALGYFLIFLVREQRDTTAEVADEEAEETSGLSKPSRRRFVVGMTAFFMAVLGAGIGAGAFRQKAVPGDFDITPTDEFYKVSKNAFDPKVNSNGWKLTIDGLVSNPLTFDYNSVQNLPVQTQAHTLTCISNTVGGEYIGNAEWKGTGLKGLLEKAGVKLEAKRVVFTSADGYTDSIPLEKALEPGTMLAWEMNGAPLTDGHGYPLRMLIPDIYGMKNAKWLTAITLVADENYQGFWQKQGWDNVAIIQTQSTITAPTDTGSVKTGEVTTIKGIAFAGARGIQKVEVSTDGGATWQEASVKPALSAYSWSTWKLDWTPKEANKRYVLVVRATDKTGKLQSAENKPSFPSGPSGLHKISVQSV